MKEDGMLEDFRDIVITNSDKVLFPGDGITKGDLIKYYASISGVILPHLKDRPVTMHRFPDGIEGTGFFQQDISDSFPDYIDRITLDKKEGGRITHLLCNNAATLVYMANLACITPHIWLSRADKLHHPDKIVFDLDPSGDFEQVRSAAFHLREIAPEVGLEPFVMLTGSRGLHVIFPLNRSDRFDEVRSFAQGLAKALICRHPDLFTIEQYKDRRHGRVFIDTLRNSYGQTSVAPYAVRARAGAPVATPIEWRELGDERVNSRRYSIKSLIDRMAQRNDPWKKIWEEPQSLKRAGSLLKDMLKKC
jgi:bifunctional non-homologous end joining protein LigD